MSTFEEIQKEAKRKCKVRAEQIRRYVDFKDACHNQEIKGYLFRAVTDIARKCGVSESEVWAEMEYWSIVNDKKNILRI